METALDARTHLVRVRGDATVVARELRSAAGSAAAAARTRLIVDLTSATNLSGPLAWELCRAHERLLWRAGGVTAVSGSTELEPLLGAFGLHRSPDVVPTLEAGLAAAHVSEAGIAKAHDSFNEGALASAPGPPGTDAGAAAAPAFDWRRHDDLPASWGFELSGGPRAPGVARAAVGRVMRGRLPESRRAEAILLVNEAVTNSVVHGGAGPGDKIELSVTISGAAVRVEVTDPAGGFEPPAYPTDPLALSGRGLPLIHSLARMWGTDPAPGGRLWFELSSQAA